MHIFISFGQIQVLAEFESSIFDEVHVHVYIRQVLRSLSDWRMIFHDFMKYLVFVLVGFQSTSKYLNHTQPHISKWCVHQRHRGPLCRLYART